MNSNNMTSFKTELYKEHLEEAACLYEQRMALMFDPELTWLDLADYEVRCERHLNVLSKAGRSAREVVTREAISDAGALFVAVTLFARDDDFEALNLLWPDLDDQDPECCDALEHALLQSAPQSWAEPLLTAARNHGTFEPAVIRWLGMRRFAVPAAEPSVHAAFASGRLGDHRATAWLTNCLQEPEIAKEAAIALIRLGDPQIHQSLKAAIPAPWSLLPLGLAGGAGDAVDLINLGRSKGLPMDALPALGLLGNVKAIPLLLDYLGLPQAASGAAFAMELITGAHLMEDIFIADPIDRDELFDDELELLEQGKEPVRSDGEPYGEEVTRLCESRDVWLAWWRENGNRFDPGTRYRLGKPHNAANLIAAMAAETTPNQARVWMAHELAGHYGITTPFEPEMTVAQQIQAIQAMRETISAG